MSKENFWKKILEEVEKNDCPILDRNTIPTEWCELVSYHTTAKRILPKHVPPTWH